MKYLLAGFLALAPLTIGQTPEAVRVGMNSVAYWEAVTVDVAGSPEIMGSYTLAIFDETGLQISSMVIQAEQATTSMAILIAGMPNNTDGNLRVQAIDAAGNKSEWSDPLPIRVDNTPPKKPGRPGCQILK